MSYLESLPYPIMILSLLVYIPLRYFYRKKKQINTSFIKETIYVSFIFYLESILYFTIFSSIEKGTGEIIGVNLIPFQTIIQYMKLFQTDYLLHASVNIIGNIVVFIPLGIFIVLLKKHASFLYTTIVGLISSLSIEITQLILSSFNFMSRSFDVDDLILNTLGVSIGYFILAWKGKK
ncbi:VanZ family protein [Oceanobacillus piezotolerans]|uniref:VanZ family protein n=1 Tax=Oceanobacillus piezotolerans TaxID=2448030 RepID=A0A498DC43_9BACI|nr:VanZ family protein [Oceanobacillus piezotolerans]RLL46537.1 VanZ family protein [Oceanobacillus piezotolerans]